MFPLLKGYKKKKVGDDCILYLDPNHQDGVIAVEGRNLKGIEGRTLTFVLFDSDTAKYFLCLQFENEEEFSAIPIRLSDIFVIPDRKKVLNMELVGKLQKEETSFAIPNIVYNVSNYCALNDPQYKDCNFSGSLLMIYLANSVAQIYKASLLVGDGVICCDGNPWGTIKGAYQFRTALLRKVGGRIIPRR